MTRDPRPRNFLPAATHPRPVAPHEDSSSCPTFYNNTSPKQTSGSGRASRSMVQKYARGFKIQTHSSPQVQTQLVTGGKRGGKTKKRSGKGTKGKEGLGAYRCDTSPSYPDTITTIPLFPPSHNFEIIEPSSSPTNPTPAGRHPNAHPETRPPTTD